MSTADHPSAYLQQCAAAHHESVYRATASYLCNPLSPCMILACRLRKCRREGTCCGPMVPSSRLQARSLRLRDAGLYSTAGTTVPLCMVSADDTMFETFEEGKTYWSKVLADSPAITWPMLAPDVRAGISDLRSRGAQADADGVENL